MTPIEWVLLGALIAGVLALVAIELWPSRQVKGVQLDHVERRDELLKDAAEYEVRGLSKNAAACMRSAEDEHKKVMGNDEEVTE